jgi:N-acetylglucosaminyldiphosphoundecaprenol N-acetyl-beta-D-mannosaminyltransferase
MRPFYNCAMRTSPVLDTQGRPEEPRVAAGVGAVPRVRGLAGLDIDRLTEEQVVGRVLDELAAGRGGWIGTPNVAICRVARREPTLHRLISGASLAVPDGMPLLWAARLRGTPLAERVTGAALIFSLSEAAARTGRSVYFLGGPAGVPEQAGEALCARYPGLTVAGADAPPMGFDATPEGIDAVRAKVTAAGPDIVFVGLGFPKQERLIGHLAPSLPAGWFVACGAAIPIAAGVLPRAPLWMQGAGLEWVFRLAREPQRLWKRYRDDLPFAAQLLARCAAERLGLLRATSDDPLPLDGDLLVEAARRQVVSNEHASPYVPSTN